MSVSDNRLLVLALSIPAIEFHAATSCQQGLAVHFHGALAADLSTGQVGIMRAIYVVVGQGLVHLHVEVQSVQEHWGILIGHQVALESIQR